MRSCKICGDKADNKWRYRLCDKHIREYFNAHQKVRLQREDVKEAARQRTAKWRAENRERHRRSVLDYQKDHPESVNARVRRSYHKNIDAERQRGIVKQMRRNASIGEMTGAEWQAILTKYGHRCVDCGSTENLCRDHEVPVLGDGFVGCSYAFNIVPRCRACNCRKSNKISGIVQHSLFDRIAG